MESVVTFVANLDCLRRDRAFRILHIVDSLLIQRHSTLSSRPGNICLIPALSYPRIDRRHQSAIHVQRVLLYCLRRAFHPSPPLLLPSSAQHLPSNLQLFFDRDFSQLLSTIRHLLTFQLPHISATQSIRPHINFLRPAPTEQLTHDQDVGSHST